MGAETMMLRGSSAAVVQVLLAARADGVHINRTKLAKLLYLSDLEAVQRGLAPGSGVEWLWRHYGPYSDVLREIEEDLSIAGIVGVIDTQNYYGSPERRLRLLQEAPQVEIDEAFAEIVNRLVASLGSLTATQLKERTYQTAPMLAAQEAGAREVRLDLTGGMPYPDMEPVLARFRVIAASMTPLGETESGAAAELAEELNEWAPLRQQATTDLLGGE